MKIFDFRVSKIILFLIIEIMMTYISFSQSIPNSGFEFGIDSSVTDWNLYSIAKRTKTFAQGNDTVLAKSGNYFLQMTTNTKISQNGEIVIIPKAEITLPFVGYPDSLTFIHCYFPTISQDAFKINCEFLKYSPDEVVVESSVFNGFNSKQSSWKRSTYGFDFFFGKPNYDSLRITILPASSSSFPPLYGKNTSLLIDDIQLIYIKSDVEDIECSNISIYPNPSDGEINISNDNIIDNIKVSNILGETIFESGNNETNFKLKIQKNGVYNLILKSNNRIINRKVIIKN